MKWFRQTLRNNRVFLLTVLAVNIFYMVEGVRFVEARQLRLQEEERHLEEFSAVFGIPMEKLRGDGESVFEPIKKLVVDGVGSAVEAGFDRLQKIVRQRKDQAVSHLSQAQTRVGDLIVTSKRSLSSGPQVQIAAAFPQERPSPIQASGKERVSRAPRSRERSASSFGTSAGMPLPLRRVEKKVRTEEAIAPVGPSAKSAVRIPPPVPREVIPKDGIAPEIVALAESLGNSPAKIFSRVHDSIDFDPKWGVHRSPLGTLHEGRGTSWDQAWLLQQLLTAAGVDARFQWGEIEIPTEILLNLAGVEDPWQAGNLMTTAGVPIVLVVQGSQVLSVRMFHVWLTAYIDFIPNRGMTPGPGDYWVRMDPTLKRFAIADGVRLDDQVPFDLGEYLESGTPFSPRQVYEEALQAHIADNNLGITLEEVKPSKTVIQDAFPFVPGSLRGRILTFEGESPELPAAFQQRLDLELRNAAGGVLATWSTPWSAVGGKRLEVAWPGATVADQSALDLYGGVFATPPYEVDLMPVIRVDGLEVAAGSAIGSAEDVVLLATITPPQGSPTVMQFEMLAGEHGVFTVDFGQMPQEVIDHYTEELSAATDPLEQEAWTLALAGALYQRLLSGDLEHLSGLRWQRLVQLGTAVLAVQRGAVSEAADGTPLVFSKGPMSLDLGAMPLGLFPASGAAGSTVPTLELLGSQGSFLEGEALSQVIGGEQITAVTFLTRAVREGQTLTLVDAGNVDTALAGAELSAEAEAHVHSGVEKGKIAWISESQLPVDTWQTSGYILEDPDTGAGGYFVTFERLVEGMEANIVFHSPQDLDVVTEPIDVVATIESESLESWTLSHQFVGEGQPVVLATGTGSVSNSTLAQFDPTLLLNGLYDIVLTGRDIAGQSVSGKVSVSVEGNMKIGNFTLSFIDLAIPLSGLDIEIVRTYDSRQREMKGDFGYGWTLDIRQGSYQNNRPPGDGWQIVNPGGPFGLPCSAIIESKSHLTTVRLSDQEIYRFRLKLVDPAVLFGGCQARAVFEWVDGPLPGTTLEILGNTEVLYQNVSDFVIDSDSFEIYQSQQVRLETADGRIFDLDLDVGVTRIEDLNGNELEITPEGITHSSGQSIEFTRDADGRIAVVTDPLDREIQYTYDAASDLVAVRNREEATSRFFYNGDHGLVEIETPNGVTSIRNDYDDYGRLVRHTDAFGSTFDLTHELSSQRELVTNRLGQTRLLEYDARGNVVREVNEAGKETLRTFDARDNLLTRTTPLGHTTTFTYDANNNLTSVTDPLGHTTTRTYNARGQLLTVTDPRGGITTQTFDANGNLTSGTDALGNVMTFTYDVAGNRLSVTDPEGRNTQFAYDAKGNLTRQIDARGHEITFTYDAIGNRLTQTETRTIPAGTETLVTSFTYDTRGRVIGITQPDGTTASTSFDALGNVTGTVDEVGRTITLSYDDMGRLVETTYPDGTTENRTYDAEDRLLAQIDRAGRTTSFSYDAVGRRISTTFPDGAVKGEAYDDAGRLVEMTDERGNTTHFQYDAAGRCTKVIDPLGNEIRFTSDENGNRTSLVDARGATTNFVYDALNRLVRTVFPDGAEKTLAYDGLGRLVADTDPAGRNTQFDYDALGHLTSVTDALGQITQFSHDQLGNRISQTDANGHTTRFEYDALGRQTKRTLPGSGSLPAPEETMNYDAVGNLIARTDFNGATVIFAYDVNNQLVSKNFPDGSGFTWTYTATGRRESVTDSRGTTVYTYDPRDRLASVTNPDGRALFYAYDAHGNRTGLTAAVGDGTTLDTYYTYDTLNRPATVVDPNGHTYTYTYDPNGNRASIGYPNGVETYYSYDARNRLTELQTATAEDDLLQSYTYTLDAVGNRTRIVENDGTTHDYTYDELHRMTDESVTRAALLIYRNVFTYDPVSNRLTQEHTVTGGNSITIPYTYDQRDRLLSEAGSSLTWDENGNVTAAASEGASYVWDFENRLVRSETADGTVTIHAYDADGNRIRTEVNTSAETRITEFLVDPSDALSQVVAEIDVASGLSAYYLRGDHLLAVIRSGATRYYHADGLGSIRLLTDGNGLVTDRYTFSAFGELLEHQGDDPNSYLFAGEPLDPNTGFYFNRARWMDPELGRFLSMDPFAGVVSDPQTLHKYLYAWANPVNFTDPSGEFGFANVAVTGAIISGLIGGSINAIGAQSPREFVGRFLIGALANGIATYVAFLVANPLAQGAIAGGLAQVFTILWEERHDLKGAFTAENLGEVLVAALIGAFAGGIVGEKWTRRLFIPKNRDLWQNVWKARGLSQFTKNIRLGLASGAVGGAVGSTIGMYVLEHVDNLIYKVGLDRFL